MNKQVIYLQEVSNYDDILKKEHSKIPWFIKNIIFTYKRIFNIVTKKSLENNLVWILPIKNRYDEKKIRNILQKYCIKKDSVYIASDELISNGIYKIMDEYKIKYVTEEKIKKVLLLHIFEYICNIQEKELSNIETTILVNNVSEINFYVIEEIAKRVKNLKIVSLNIYKFKKLEERLYNEYGIPIQFSNSYKKSLEKSKYIINLDFNEFEINEYDIFDKAIVINCIKDEIKVKSRLFSGIIINSCEIEFGKELSSRLKNMNMYNRYRKILLYASIIENEENIFKMNEKLIIDKVNIEGLIGSRGVINKKEFKNIEKSLTKIKKQSNI